MLTYSQMQTSAYRSSEYEDFICSACALEHNALAKAKCDARLDSHLESVCQYALDEAQSSCAWQDGGWTHYDAVTCCECHEDILEAVDTFEAWPTDTGLDHNLYAPALGLAPNPRGTLELDV